MRDRAGRLPIHYEASEGRTDDLRRSLAAGTDATLPDDAGFTPLHFAAQNLHAEAAQALIDAGASLQARNKFGATPLHLALFNVRDTEGAIVRVLLAAGADPDDPNDTGVTPRGLAQRVSNYDLMRFFRDD